MTGMDATPPPVTCTLTTKALAQRTLEWRDLGPLALERTELDDGVRSTYPLDLATPIEQLAGAERACCGSWLDIEVTRTDVVTLELTTTNPEGLAIIRSMAGIA
ncbi:MAG: hypothetical protein DHS20C19_24840 [Acidimicrobiales bacterium]|nr:MAG: hypothetical protein DHS20C19_24840 [Acidimicrobiales bacterium]